MDTFRAYVERAYPRFAWYPHMTRLAAALERIAAGDLKRLLVFMPPRHGKTLLAGMLFPAYYLTHYPHRWVGLSSYGAALAHTLSRSARTYYRDTGGEVRRDAHAASHWETTGGGGLWASGVGGPLTGKGAHLLLLDDPVKNSNDAASATLRRNQRDWFASTFYTRAEPDAAVILIQTRWHEEDLSGWLLEEEKCTDNPEGWHIISLPALAEPPDARPLFPASCTVEAEWRAPGEALCPERFDARALARIRARQGGYFWAALYQQQPRPAEGSLFQREWLPVVPAAPDDAKRVRYWDCAATADGGDYTVGARLAATRDGLFFVEDVVRGQWAPGKRDDIMRRTAEADGRNVRIVIEQEPGSSGISAIAAQLQNLSAYNVRGQRVTGSKSVRAAPFAAQAEAGNVRLVAGHWNEKFIEELIAFPNAAHDDQVDAVSGAFNALAPARRIKFLGAEEGE